MLRKNTQRSWGMKWLEGVDKYQILTTHKEHGISPETLSDLRSSLEDSFSTTQGPCHEALSFPHRHSPDPRPDPWGRLCRPS